MEEDTGDTEGVEAITEPRQPGSGGSPQAGELLELGGGEPPPAGESEALSASLEDYLEAILQLERTSRVARVSEIAERLDVSRPSVTGALKALSSRGLVSHARYGHVTLTEEGAAIASEVEGRHVAIRDFLTGVLGVPEDKAEVAACRMEHVLEPDVLAHFARYTEKHGAVAGGGPGGGTVGPDSAEDPRSAGPGRGAGDCDAGAAVGGEGIDRRSGQGEPMTSLSELSPFVWARVAGLPQASGLAKRLIALGLTPGAEVRVLQNWGHCPLIIEAHGARLAVGRGQAARVMVELLSDTDEGVSSAEDESAPGDE
jgi:DtxR family Mn-dependent transcriptional regulator